MDSDDLYIGLSGLNLCDEYGWKEKVDVCPELLTAYNRTENPDANANSQENYCSFGSFSFELTSTGRNKRGAGCRPYDGERFHAIISHANLLLNFPQQPVFFKVKFLLKHVAFVNSVSIYCGIYILLITLVCSVQ